MFLHALVSCLLTRYLDFCRNPKLRILPPFRRAPNNSAYMHIQAVPPTYTARRVAAPSSGLFALLGCATLLALAGQSWRGFFSAVELTPWPQQNATPMFVLALGVEGSSHHGVDDIILQSLAHERCRVDDSCDAAKSGECLKRTHFRDRKLRLNLYAQSSRDGHVLHPTAVDQIIAGSPAGSVFIEDGSYPSGFRLRDPPHPLNLSTALGVLDQAQPQISVRLLLLVRNFGSTVWSHHDWDNGMASHAERLASHLAYLGAELERLPRDDWFAVPVDCLYSGGSATREAFAASLASFLGWKTRCCLTFDGFRASNHHFRTQASPAQVAAMDAIEARRRPEWGSLAALYQAANRSAADPKECDAMMSKVFM